MVEVDLATPATADVPGWVVRRAGEGGLTVTMTGTLAKYPGSHHWHFKRSGEPGTLELTWWPKTGRLWFKLAAHRRADWMESAIASWQ
jgi:hypothetical protein